MYSAASKSCFNIREPAARGTHSAGIVRRLEKVISRRMNSCPTGHQDCKR
ncbi:uncharacterized protein PHALS_08868 [Plasmopara halstedii]|uniref:Uncharacterized protein n=1 Tax=Plasmopara halstedii TaxID=4781 RepID=A0A0P1ADE9_PLAHL|nr:uncharacterized protein PHALS_08868 [Plasmopara halstedii]CEG38816.1 hypothetical protein PHALS_08868 [Plasmopara halstedii]|eukprot:XP_024575185.1 hypothetical protein PHALS_08868 [Plasmopara halstedii]